jgi:aspartate-semialdehyde dehydrogenase
MSEQPIIVVAGATGVVGNEMIRILEERKTPCKELRLLASENSVGELYSFHGQEVEVRLLTEEAFAGAQYALFATSADLSAKYVPAAAELGVCCIDNSSHFRMAANVPLVVPEVNASAISIGEKIIANPNCSTIQLVPVLKVFEELAGLERVVVSTYQAVSGAGKAALDELWESTRSVFTQQEKEPEAFPHTIAFNCIPQIDVVLDSGYTKEEMKIINESRKILGLANLKITATTVRVPVFHSHAESVNIQTQRSISREQIIELLEKTPGIRVYPNYSDYPMQRDVAGTDEIHVGRLRKDESAENAWNLWIVADNVRKGAALNAVQILEQLIR